MDGGSLNLQSAGRTFSHNAEKIFGRSILIRAKKTEFMIFGTLGKIVPKVTIDQEASIATYHHK
jgi:hypothetical protein